MNDLQIFTNPDFGEVRTIEENGAVMFCGSDVAKALGYSNPRDAISRHCRGVVKRDTPTESGTQEESENERIEAALLASAHRLDDVTVTHYGCCVECCGKTDGITASGVRATPGVTVAVDPDVIPLGADVLVDYGDGEICYYRADDTGSGVVGNHIDLCVADHQTAVQLGRRTATVWWVSA